MSDCVDPHQQAADIDEIARTRARAERGCMIDASEYIRLHNTYNALFNRWYILRRALENIRFDALSVLMDTDPTFGPEKDGTS